MSNADRKSSPQSTSPLGPMSLLNFMTQPGHLNTLAAYAQLGGEVWLVGGGGAFATLYKFNSIANDDGYGSTIFSSFGGSTRPVYVDIDPKTFNIDPAKIEAAITPKTRAIIPVHLYGQPADMDPIMAIARHHGLRVIEDCAQAMGASYKATKVGTIGDIGCISFFPSKNLGCFGDGGMMVTNDKPVAERMHMIASHGSRVKYYHEVLGVNSRLDTIQAAILGVKLRHLEEYNSARQDAAVRYDRMLEGTPVTVPYEDPKGQHIYHQYTMRAPRRDALADFLKGKEIPHAIYYPVPLHLQEAFKISGSKKGDFPVSEQAADEVLSLPMHTELTEEQQALITGAITEFYA